MPSLFRGSLNFYALSWILRLDSWHHPEAKALAAKFVSKLPEIKRLVETDVQAAYEGDPAATSPMEVVMAYPGLYAVTVHRLAHELYKLSIPVIPRIMSEIAHSKTGIDIHPGATIGERFFIDHGTGVVIGETTVIGRNVKLYQGVTLGAKSFAKDPVTGALVKGINRHPNVEDNVVIYAGRRFSEEIPQSGTIPKLEAACGLFLQCRPIRASITRLLHPS